MYIYIKTFIKTLKLTKLTRIKYTYENLQISTNKPPDKPYDVFKDVGWWDLKSIYTCMSKMKMIKGRMAAGTIHIYEFQGPKVMTPTQIPGLMTPHKYQGFILNSYWP